MLMLNYKLSQCLSFLALLKRILIGHNCACHLKPFGVDTPKLRAVEFAAVYKQECPGRNINFCPTLARTYGDKH